MIPRLVRRQNLCGMCERMLFVLVIVSVLARTVVCGMPVRYQEGTVQYLGGCFLVFFLLFWF